MRKIKKVLIAERGEMGLRALEICLSMGIDFVVGFAAADSNSLLVKKAKKHSFQNRSGGISYLGEDLIDGYQNVEKIIATARLWHCDAIYPGYGHLAENYPAVKKIQEAGLRWIGPDARVIKLFGDRYAARKAAEQAGLAVLDAFLITTKQQAIKNCRAKKITFPFMLKSLASGGGRGNNMIKNENELRDKLSQLELSTEKYYAEEYASGRHIELQFMAGHAGVRYLGARDCTCQIKFQKILEEGPAGVNEKQLSVLKKKLSPLLAKLSYTGIGTAEFIYDPRKDKFYFLEINPRIQVESPVTEKLFGLDLVAFQFALSQGDETVLQKEYLPEKKYVIEARVYARDPFNHFIQTEGRLKKFKTARINAVTYHSGYQAGDLVPSFYDPLLLKIIASGRSRKESLQKLKRSLVALQISGVATNRDLLLWLLTQKEFQDQSLTQDFIKKAWQKHLAYLKDDKRKFLETGIFEEIIATEKINPQKLINDLKYSRNGIQRNYLTELNSKHMTSPQKTAFRFGIFHRNNSPIIFSWWDFSYFGGTLGVDEAQAIEKCFTLARQKKLPVIMVTRSGGARQQENTLALSMMQYILHTFEKNGRPFFINVYDRENFGGLNASLAGIADIKIATAKSYIGLAGPKFLATLISTEGKLPPDAQSAKEHYAARNIDILSPDLFLACEKALAICQLTQNKNSSTESKFKKIATQNIQSKELSVSECLRYLNSPKRLHFSDLVKPEMKIFDEIAPLSNFEATDVPIMAALVQLGKHKVMLIGQQNIDQDGKILSPAAKDFHWLREKMRLAEKLNLPIILFGDTNGADASLDSEYAGVSQEIAHSLSDQTKLSVPIISLNLGFCGSGGGLPFVNPADASAALERSLKMVSDIRVQGAILSGKNDLSNSAQKKLLDMLQDSTAQGQLHYGLIDEIIPHADNKKILAENIKKFVVKKLDELAKLDKKNLLGRRLQRQKKIVDLISR